MPESSSQSENYQDWLISIRNIETQGEARRPQKPKIQKIPQMLRRNQSNEDCYEPIVVSIGPYHHGKGRLQQMEELKTRSLKQYLGEVQITFNEFKTMFSEARASYEEGSAQKFSDNDFTKMMLLDGCFILHFIHCGSHGNSNERNMNDQHIAYVTRDLFLLENQLPFIVLEELMKLKYPNVNEGKNMIKTFVKDSISAPHHQDASSQLQQSSISRLMIDWGRRIREFPIVLKAPISGWTNRQSGTESVRQTEADKQLTAADKSLHLLDMLWIELVGKDQNANDSAIQPQNKEYTFRSVEELRMAGISCKKSKTSSLKDVQFKSFVFGSLSLPPIAVDDVTESMFLNLIAYETCPDAFVDYAVTAYICLMDSLIDHTGDVKELRSQGILLNRLGSDQQVANLFNQLGKDLLSDVKVYGKATSQIQNHCSSTWKPWLADVYYTHFRSPWTIIAFIAAIVVIGLTATQTFFTVFPRNVSSNKAPPHM